MYGFIEKWAADLIGVEYDPYVLSSGSKAAMVGQDAFSTAFSIMTVYWKEVDGRAETMPQIVSSDIHGMRVVVHPFYYDMGILEGFTDGAVKESESYMAMVNSAMPFSSNRFNEFVIEYKNNAERTEDATPVEAPARPVRRARRATATPVETEESQEEKFLATLTNRCLRSSSYRNKESKTGKKVFCSDHCEIGISTIFDFAEKVGKHVIVTENSVDVLNIKKYLSKDKIQKYLVIIIISPKNFNRSFVHQRTGTDVRCFGRSIRRYYVVYGEHVNEKIEQIEKDSSLSKSEKLEKIEQIKVSESNSPYSNYDMVFKDTVTNVPFAVKDRSFVYLMFDSYENSSLTIIAFGEIARRYNGDISLTELRKIDEGHQNSIQKENKKKYIDFAVQSSNAIVDELRTKFEEHKKQYQSHMQQAMEHGKLMRKFMQQLDAFDYENHKKEEQNKAEREYEMTLELERVSSISIIGDIVNIYTNNIYARDERSKKLHDIGTFHIQLGMHSNRYDPHSSVKVTNTKHVIKAYDGQPMQAPHIFSNGEICHGGLATGMTDAYARRDLYQLVLQLVLFLQQANTDDPAGKHIDKWPIVSEEVLKPKVEEDNTSAKPVEVEVDKEIVEVNKEFDEVFAEAIQI